MTNPLVSVVVISYNSSKTIEETLDSIRNQTYSPLELIISDDASPDDTVNIAKAWMKKNRSRFVRAEILVAEKNGGIPVNLNRGIAVSNGEFLKSIAADDILLPNCISDNVAFMQANPEAKIVFSKIREFHDEPQGNRFFSEKTAPASVPNFFNLSAKEQHDELLNECCCNAPTAFFKTNFIKSSPYSVLYPAMEDWPKWINATNSGVKLFFLDKETVFYRVGDSVSSTAASVFYSSRFMDSRKLFYLHELRSELTKRGMKKLRAKYDREFLRYDLLMALFDNKKTWWSSVCRHLISRFLKVFVR